MKFVNPLRNIIIGLFALLPASSLNKYGINLSKEMPVKIAPKQIKLPKDIIVFDDFSDKCININNDSIYDTSHGELVSQIIKAELPNSCIKRIDVMLVSDDSMKLRKNNEIDNLLKTKYDAANLSVGLSMSFKALSEKIGMNITKENIASKTKEIKQYFRNNPQKYLTTINGIDIKMGYINEFFKEMDSLSARGTKFYVSASNGGAEHLNLVSLIDNAQVIGAADQRGVKGYSCSNSLINRFCNDAVWITKVKGGYSINGSKIKAFDDNQVTVYSKEPYVGIYRGTSFSSPRVLAMDLGFK